MLVSGDRKKQAQRESEKLGLPVELIEESETFAECDFIYPDNTDPVRIFKKCLTQWRSSGFGIIGLDYNVVFKFMERSIPDEAWDTVLDGIRIMEGAALNVIKEQSKIR